MRKRTRHRDIPIHLKGFCIVNRSRYQNLSQDTGHRRRLTPDAHPPDIIFSY